MLNWPPGKKRKEAEKEEAPKPLLSAEDREALGYLERPMETLASSLGPSIEDGSIGAVIGVQGSGQLPAEMLGGMLDKLYEKRKHPSPFKAFIALSRPTYQGETFKKEMVAAVRTWAKRLAPSLDRSKKVLIVDDSLVYGETIQPVYEAFHELGFAVEVAVVSTTRRNPLSIPRPLPPGREKEELERRSALWNRVHDIEMEMTGGDLETDRRLKEKADAIRFGELTYKIPLHVGEYAGEMRHIPYNGGTVVKPREGVDAAPSTLTPAAIAAREFLGGIADRIVARYEAGKEKPPA